jgi:hypothetical protein
MASILGAESSSTTSLDWLLVIVAKLLRLITLVSWIAVWVVVIVAAYRRSASGLRWHFVWVAVTSTVSYLLGFWLYAKSKTVRANVPRTWADRMIGGRSGIESYLENPK